MYANRLKHNNNIIAGIHVTIPIYQYNILVHKVVDNKTKSYKCLTHSQIFMCCTVLHKMYVSTL